MLHHLILRNVIFYHFNVALLRYFDIKLYALFNITHFVVALCEVALFNDALFDAVPFHCSTI